MTSKDQKGFIINFLGGRSRNDHRPILEKEWSIGWYQLWMINGIRLSLEV
ncbi:MAG: hypothetical protein WCF23_16715 [Candidatus Nitrosopolaris sp.]